jgi:hypothetical protein
MLLVLTWLVPLVAAGLAPSPRFWWLPAITALPALAAVVLVPSGYEIEIPWLLLGSVLGLDWTGRIFLGFTAILWLAAGLHAAGSMRASPHAGRFRTFFLLAMAGNLWLIVGQDLASFYAGFSLMGLASYGLVVHNRDRLALRAGKVYRVMTVLGELTLFVALVMIANETETLVPKSADLIGLSDLTVGLLLAGLAIKAGLVPVHVWLPLAYPAAPVPASAVLSGAMSKVALLGWLRFLPIGEVPMTEWGLLLIVTGLLTLFYALPIGLVQSPARHWVAWAGRDSWYLSCCIRYCWANRMPGRPMPFQPSWRWRSCCPSRWPPGADQTCCARLRIWCPPAICSVSPATPSVYWASRAEASVAGGTGCFAQDRLGGMPLLRASGPRLKIRSALCAAGPMPVPLGSPLPPCCSFYRCRR